MDIAAPKRSIDDDHYNADLQDALDLPVLNLLDQVCAAGWSKREVFKAFAEVIHNRALAYEEDPDPDDATSEIETSETPADRLVAAFVDGRDVGP